MPCDKQDVCPQDKGELVQDQLLIIYQYQLIEITMVNKITVKPSPIQLQPKGEIATPVLNQNCKSTNNLKNKNVTDRYKANHC